MIVERNGSMKVFFRETRKVEADEVIAMMQRWIRESRLPGLLIDVVDYRHVLDGPGIMLGGGDELFAVETQFGQTGLRYLSRRPASLDDLLGRAVQAARLVEESPEIRGGYRLVLDRLELAIRDQLRVPRGPKTFERLRPALLQHFTEAFDGEVHLAHVDDTPFAVRVRGGSRGLDRPQF